MANEIHVPADGAGLVELADWRRRVADLYAFVRSESERGPEAARRRWRDVREDLFRTHSQSPRVYHRAP